MASLKDFIKEAVPKMTPDDLTNLVAKFETLGIRLKEDCSKIKREELTHHLKPDQIFQFWDACRQG